MAESTEEEQSMRVETDILNWSTFNDTGTGGQVLFTLPRKGILDGNYVTLNLSMLKAAATNKLPMNVGILGCLESATLYYQNEAIQTTEFAGQRNRLMNLKEDSDIRNQKHNVEYGCFDGQKVRSGVVSVTAGAYVAGQPFPGQFFYDPDIVGLDLSSVGVGAAFIQALNNADRDPQFDAGLTAATTANYRIRLSQIFPLLSQVELPLGLLNGQFTIQIRFSDDVIGNRCVPSSTWTNADPTVETRHNFVPGNLIDPNTCNLVVDYIYYDVEEGTENPYDLLAANMQAGGQELVYTDLVNINISAPNLAAAPAAIVTQAISNRLNVNGQVIRNLLIAMPRQVTTTDLALGGRMNQVYGRYESLASMGNPAGSTLQLLVNNLPIFPSPLNTDGKIYSELCEALQTECKVNQGSSSLFNQVNANGLAIDPKQSYQMSSTIPGAPAVDYCLNGFCFGKSTSWSLDAAGRELMSGLDGTDSYMGIDLTHTREHVVNAGTTIGTSPLQLEIVRSLTPAVFAAQQVIVWIEAERIMRISNGDIFVSGS
jgi:hypothetical protein